MCLNLSGLYSAFKLHIMSKNKKSYGLFTSLLLFAVIIPANAYANVAIPTVFFTIPAMLIALIPVVVVEAYILAKTLKISFHAAIKPTSVANIVSTIVGFPLASAIHTVVAYLILTVNVHNKSNVVHDIWQAVQLGVFIWDVRFTHAWAAPMAYCLFLISTLALSIIIEYLIIRKMLFVYPRRLILIGTVYGNLVSYTILSIVVLIILLSKA